MKTIAIILILAVSAQAAPRKDDDNKDWNSYKSRYAKKYKDKNEERQRMKIFIDNKHAIEEHNKLYVQGKVSFKMEMNRFGDLLPKEVEHLATGYRQSKLGGALKKSSYKPLPRPSKYEPKTVDWKKAGAVTPVKDQGACGSCWAFSVVGALESHRFIKSKKLVALSEQNLIDCADHKYNNLGCDGGVLNETFRYVAENGILPAESYPYEEKKGICRQPPSRSASGVNDFVQLPMGDESELKSAVARVGPVSVAMDASHSSFEFYKQGIYYEKECSSENLDHAMLLIGYGTENGTDYWLLKNSWGTEWGDQGYVKMVRNKKNNCGVATDASYPIL